ncbi:MAG: hydroxymethylglutaryl-CoA reductase, degradative [Halobacteriovoraceae bacterium]|nr:hydroxymethylglutaryl-CoA reductase, degradative [Halobacteriovoraceae bacterium]
MEKVTGFSQLTKEEKIEWLLHQLHDDLSEQKEELYRFCSRDFTFQKIFEDFSENTISNFHMPYGVAPNFKINNKIYTVPMVIEESSVVAAASKAAKFWIDRGGFRARIINNQKVGHIYLTWDGEKEKLFEIFEQNKERLLNCTMDLTTNMEKRGGGITGIELIDQCDMIPHFYKIEMKFVTCDAMGANFINSVLEKVAKKFEIIVQNNSLSIVMAILSNYTPECVVECRVFCSLEELGSIGLMTGPEFAKKFKMAVDIARVDRDRAVTHNKGIMNGVDAVVLATGNDFRAIEACCHAYAARDGLYKSLSEANLIGDNFEFKLTIPLSLGTVGGLTRLHPLAKFSLEVLGAPGAEELMMIIASVGLAQNFAAVQSLVTTGIQKGHMKMHLLNILNMLGATKMQKEAALRYYSDKVVDFNSVRSFLENTGHDRQK